MKAKAQFGWRLGVTVAVAMVAAGTPAAGAGRGPARRDLAYEASRLRPAVRDLMATFPDRYGHGEAYLRRLDAVEAAIEAGKAGAAAKLDELRRDALLSNPLLAGRRLLLVRRKVRKLGDGRHLGMPTNHECNSSLRRVGYDNEIAVLAPIGPEGTLTTLYRPKHRVYVGEIELHYDADRLLFTRSDGTSWKVWEVGIDPSTGRRPKDSVPRQVSQMPDDVDAFDACYLPDGGIVFGCTATFQSVPCWHGQKRVSTLYRMDAEGGNVRQLCYDQDHDFHPTVLPTGQVLFHRWDYTGINHIFLRQLMVMNPDGTGQRAVYGSGSWYPNSLYFPRAAGGDGGRIVCILSGYHGARRMGQLVVLDTDRGFYGADGIVRRISGRGEPVRPRVADRLVDRDWPKFLHPFPLSEKHFLVSCWRGGKTGWAIYLADIYDNLVLVRAEPGEALLEPVLLAPRARPRRVPDRVEPGATEGVLYLHDIYAGDGLAGVPRGTVKSLRVIAYHFGYLGLAGPDKIGLGGPWEAMRILGTVRVAPDGSAAFRAPANTPLAVQALDADGKAVQLMRSWVTLMPGEQQSCIGCHERTSDTPGVELAAAMRPPDDIRPWYGPARGFDFQREVQPVLDAHCVRCHDGSPDAKGRPDLRGEAHHPDYRGRRISKLGVNRMHPTMRKATGGRVRYTPAYEALLPYIRRVSIEDDVSMLTPGEYHADTSELIQRLAAGHGGVRLDAEAWDRLVTWIDLNGPCHGTWGDVFPIPTDAHERRMVLRRRYGGPTEDPEAIPDTPAYEPDGGREGKPQVQHPQPGVRSEAFRASGPALEASAGDLPVRTVDLGGGQKIQIVRIPAGELLMGDRMRGRAALRRVRIDEPFWMAACEITNAQLRLFRPEFSSGYYTKLHKRPDDRGLDLDGDDQPAVRVSWNTAAAFCRWLADRTGRPFRLPTEAQWEYACRAGTNGPLWWGGLDADFSKFANCMDKAFLTHVVTGGVAHLDPAERALCDTRFNDKATVTVPAGRYRPNAWGLGEMHGNAAEWTRSDYGDGRKVLRGGSFRDRPKRCRAGLRLPYAPWQRVFNAGFRVVCEDAE